MKLITKEIEEKLLKGSDKPVVKFFCPWGSATWLISEMDPENPDLLFGLCDLGLGCPEMGYVSLTELQSIKGPAGIGIERDLYFTPEMTLSEYADQARLEGRIVA